MNGSDRMLDGTIPYLGHFDAFGCVVNRKRQEIDVYIIAIESSEHDKLMQILLKIDNGITVLRPFQIPMSFYLVV